MGMQITQSQETIESGLHRAVGGSDPLIQVARAIGTAAGYLQRSNANDLIRDAEQQMMRTPEGYLAAAAAVGFLAGILLRDRR